MLGSKKGIYNKRNSPLLSVTPKLLISIFKLKPHELLHIHCATCYCIQVFFQLNKSPRKKTNKMKTTAFSDDYPLQKGALPPANESIELLYVNEVDRLLSSPLPSAEYGYRCSERERTKYVR